MTLSFGAWMIAAVIAAAAGDAESGPLHVLLAGHARVIAIAVAASALDALESPPCRRLLTDFEDGGGRSLANNLAATGLTLTAYASRLYLVDGGIDRQCANPGTIAFTAPGSHVIYLCSARFTAMFGRRNTAKALMIHEILHTLGLGENPPASAEITRQVASRCQL